MSKKFVTVIVLPAFVFSACPASPLGSNPRPRWRAPPRERPSSPSLPSPERPSSSARIFPGGSTGKPGPSSGAPFNSSMSPRPTSTSWSGTKKAMFSDSPRRTAHPTAWPRMPRKGTWSMSAPTSRSRSPSRTSSSTG
ncbi:MAG: hypothetical protein M0C28_39320 [Candidatus Moduliflexus flocculans]|nr:hypothetical protein [Candidatus Moduliflexus flocculans]